MTESLHDLMIIKKEIVGMEQEIKEIKEKSGLNDLTIKLDLLKKMYQAALRECISDGKNSEGDFRVIDIGRNTRVINTQKILEDKTLTEIFKNKFVIKLKDVEEVLSGVSNGEEIYEYICESKHSNKYDVIDIMEG